MPRRFDSEALQSAAGTLPRAIEVKAMEDCTVEGSTQTNSSPKARSFGNHGFSAAVRPSPTAGNSTKVLASTRPCRRQCVMPTACVDRRAP